MKLRECVLCMRESNVNVLVSMGEENNFVIDIRTKY